MPSHAARNWARRWHRRSVETAHQNKRGLPHECQLRAAVLYFRHKSPLPQQSRIEASVSYVFFAMIAPITAPAMIAVLTLPCEYFLPPLRFLR